jgi:hypothetical protein
MDAYRFPAPLYGTPEPGGPASSSSPGPAVDPPTTAVTDPPPAVTLSPAAVPPADSPLAPYWDATGKAFKLDDLTAAWSERDKVFVEHQARVAAVPEDPAGYKLDLPTDFKIPDEVTKAGVTLKFDDKDPIVADARAMAKSLGLTQDQFGQLVAFEARRRIADFNRAGDVLQAEQKKLGDKAGTRMRAAETYLRGTLTAAEYEALRPIVTNAGAFAAVEKLIARAVGSAIPGDKSDPPPPAATVTRLADRWADPTYGKPRAG